jgi:hypothetical protein
MADDGKKGSYTLLKWNGQYGADAKFVVRDDKNGQMSIFTPGRTQDLVWTTTPLDKTPEIEKWDDFGDEQVDSLDDVAM